MKPLHYIKKYNLTRGGTKFNHSELISDLNKDLQDLIKEGIRSDGTIPIHGFDNAVSAIRQKWDSINNKVVEPLPEKLWGYFYAAVICELKEEMFPEIMKLRREKHAKYVRAQEERRRQENQNSTFFHDLWENILSRYYSVIKPMKSFRLLELNHMEVTADDVKKAYKIKAKKNHPDVGGSEESMQAINEAKVKCLKYLEK